MKTKIFITFILTFLLTFQSKADPIWGATGHRTIGEIADSYLSPKTKRQIKKLLNSQSLALVSTFGDEIKSDERYDKFYNWHFINMPLDAMYDASKRDPKGDLISGIEFCINIIKDKNASDVDKAFYLKLLVHLIGDLHQPMHIGLVEDRGGNDFKLQWFNRDTNLHSVWDSSMIEDYGMSYSELAENAEYLSKEQVKDIQKGSITDWVNDTHKLSNVVYNSVKPGENLRYEYSYKYLGILRSQLQIGGIRLAKILNDLF